MIWGSVLTVLVSNFAMPAIYLLRTSEDPASGVPRPVARLSVVRRRLARRGDLGPQGVGCDGGHGNADASLASPRIFSVGSLAYAAGYAISPSGRGDLARVILKLVHRAIGECRPRGTWASIRMAAPPRSRRQGCRGVLRSTSNAGGGAR